MNRFVAATLAFASACALADCTLLEKNARPNDDLVARGAPVVRAYFLDRCPLAQVGAAGDRTRMLFADGLVTGALSYAANKTNDALIAAVQDDQAALTLTGSNADALYAFSPEGASLRRCLAVVVAPRSPAGTWCPLGRSRAAWPDALCDQPDPASQELWNRMGLGAPAFYAEIRFVEPIPSGPANYFVPQLTGLFYPRPLANRASDRTEGVILSVKALLPTFTSAFEFLIPGEGLTPAEGYRTTGLGDRGLWVRPPPVEAASAGKVAGNPVDLVVTVTETPNVTSTLFKAVGASAREQELAKNAPENRAPPIRTVTESVTVQPKTPAAVMADAACDEFLVALNRSINESALVLQKTNAGVARDVCSQKRASARLSNTATPLCGITPQLEAQLPALCP